MESNSKCVYVCAHYACVKLWQLLSAWLGGGPFLSSPITLTSVDLSLSTDKGHRPGWWESPSIKVQKRLSPKDFTWEIFFNWNSIFGFIGQHFQHFSREVKLKGKNNIRWKSIHASEHSTILPKQNKKRKYLQKSIFICALQPQSALQKSANGFSGESQCPVGQPYTKTSWHSTL